MSEKVSYEDILNRGKDILNQAEIEDCEIDAWYLLEHFTGFSRAEYFMKRYDTVDNAGIFIKEYFHAINLRASHVPLQHITGRQEFMGLEFIVTPDVLVPRQDTETLVEYILPYTEGRNILDMCTGSGCIAVSLTKLGKAASCVAVDYSQKALEVAKSNAGLNDVCIEFIHSDMFENVTGKFDIIVSNPPYIRPEVIKTLMPEVKEHEPMMALAGGEDGLDFYRIICKKACAYLNDKGLVAVETGYDQAEQVFAMFKECGYKDVCIQKDLSGNNRVVAAFMF